MSRYSVQAKQEMSPIVKIVYGYDHACGYFYQEYDGDGECVKDVDSAFGKLTGVGLAEMLVNSCKPEHLNRNHIYAMMMDMPV